MRKYLTTAMAIALMSGVSYADLQNVEVNGSLRMRANSLQSVGFDENNSNSSWTEQRTTLGVAADFSEEVSANITLDNYGVWGDLGSSDTDVELHEAYITLGNAIAEFDLKIGRQELELGDEFLVGNNSTASGYDHFSYDGIVATRSTDAFDITLLNLKLDEEDGFDADEVDEDTDLRGVYVTYNGIENHTIDGYVLQLRTGQPGADNDELLTLGARAYGAFGGAFDYEVEFATQSGDMANDTVDYEGDAFTAELGYTFDSNLQPRVYVGVASFSGADDADEAAFNRMFSDHEYSEFLDEGNMTNVLVIRAGVGADVSEKVHLSAVVTQLELDEEILDEDEVGTEIGLYANYQYSEDVAVELGLATFLNGDYIEETVGDDEDDPIYVYAEISLAF